MCGNVGEPGGEVNNMALALHQTLAKVYSVMFPSRTQYLTRVFESGGGRRAHSTVKRGSHAVSSTQYCLDVVR